MVKKKASGEAAIPLARLMAMAFRTLIDELHARLEAQGWKDVRASYGYVLVAARDAPLTVTAVAALLGMTKQAASKLVEAMVEASYLRRSDDADDARRQRLELSAKGARLLAAVEAIYAELEGEWGEIIGEPAVERVRSDLTRVLRGLHDGRLPAIRPPS
ncbi:MAG TPA: MarR family winged helix-turn-helix transcriptional regulator [Polyangiaceae bacterium]